MSTIIDQTAIENAAIANGYVPITGPFTPAEMAETNTRALLLALDSNGVVNVMSATLDEVLKDQSIVGGDQMLCIRVDNRHASFDRWGFVGGENGYDHDDLDQVSLKTIVSYLTTGVIVK